MVDIVLGDESENIVSIFSYNNIYYRGVIPYVAGYIVRKIKKNP